MEHHKHVLPEHIRKPSRTPSDHPTRESLDKAPLTTYQTGLIPIISAEIYRKTLRNMRETAYREHTVYGPPMQPQGQRLRDLGRSDLFRTSLGRRVLSGNSSRYSGSIRCSRCKKWPGRWGRGRRKKIEKDTFDFQLLNSGTWSLNFPFEIHQPRATPLSWAYELVLQTTVHFNPLKFH